MHRAWQTQSVIRYTYFSTHASALKLGDSDVAPFVWLKYSISCVFRPSGRLSRRKKWSIYDLGYVERGTLEASLPPLTNRWVKTFGFPLVPICVATIS